MTDKPCKLLVVDIDGTLLNKNGTISAVDREALARVVAAGIPIVLSTGRVVTACRDIINQLSLDGYHIFFDGALVSNPENNEEVYTRPINQELVRQAVEFAHLNDITIDFYTSDRYFVGGETWGSDIRRDFYKTLPNVIDLAALWQKERVIKATLTVRSPREKSGANDFYLHFKDVLGFSWTKTPAYPEVDFINVLAPDVSKGKALIELTSYLGIPLGEVVAIGDGSNDISLLDRAGLAIAMGSASDELKAVADHVTLDVDHNGVAAAVNQFLLSRK